MNNKEGVPKILAVFIFMSIFALINLIMQRLGIEDFFWTSLIYTIVIVLLMDKLVKQG
jgi:hypothetical protein